MLSPWSIMYKLNIEYHILVVTYAIRYFMGQSCVITLVIRDLCGIIYV